MFKIGKLFHLTHVVDNLREADQWYDEVFSACRYYRGYMRAAMRNASVLAIGDCPLEAIQTAPVPGAENSAIGKFHARFGQHFHSIAWYVESIEDTFNQLTRNNIRQVDMVGRAAKGPFGKRNIAVWTHPKDTHGAIEFAQVEDFSIDVRLHPFWSSAFWRDRHPLGIERASHITSCPCCVCRRIAIWFPIVPVGTKIEASRPNTSAASFSSLFTVGSSL